MVIITPSNQTYQLRLGNNVIGRDPGCDLRLDADRVSRRHAVIAWDGSRALLSDLNSTNGTFVNGQRLAPNQPYEVTLGSRIELGGPQGRLEVGMASQPLDVGPLDLPPPPARSLPSWLPLALGGGAVALMTLLLLFLRKPSGPSAPATALSPLTGTPAPTLEVVVLPATSAAKPGAATPAPLPTTPPTAGSPATVGVQPPAGLPGRLPAGLSQAPPINPTTMPDLVQNILQEFLPGGLPLTPQLPGGTPLPGAIATVLPGGGLPGLPSGAAPPSAATRYGAVVLRAPANGASYQGEGANLVLEWEPINGLRANEYYRVMIFYPLDGREQAGGTWLKATSYRPPAWFLSQHNGRFEWQVVVIEASAPPERNGRPGAVVSQPSERRWFNWALDPGNPPPPTDTPTPTFQG